MQQKGCRQSPGTPPSKLPRKWHDTPGLGRNALSVVHPLSCFGTFCVPTERATKTQPPAWSSLAHVYRVKQAPIPSPASPIVPAVDPITWTKTACVRASTSWPTATRRHRTTNSPGVTSLFDAMVHAGTSLQGWIARAGTLSTFPVSSRPFPWPVSIGAGASRKGMGTVCNLP